MRQLDKAENKLEELSSKINRYYLKTAEQIEKAVAEICAAIGDQMTVNLKKKESADVDR